MIIKPGQSYNYNINKPPSEGEMPENLYLSAFCSTHTEQTVGELDKYDGRPEDLDQRPGQVKVENDDFRAILTKDAGKVIKQFEGTGYISGITGCCSHQDVKVYMEETADKRMEQVTYPEQEGMTLKNEIDKKTGDVKFTYTVKEEEDTSGGNVLKPGDSYTYNINKEPENMPENLYLSAFCDIHAKDAVGDLERKDNKEGDLDPRTGFVKIENDKYKATMTTEGTKVVKDFDGTGYLMGPSGDCHHEDVKVHFEQDGDNIMEQVTYPEQDGLTLRNEMNMKTGDVTFKYIQ